MNSPFKFLRRVRIHGGECGAVARALHHKIESSSLYQAKLEKSSGLTNERKSMSTKTSLLKRIAQTAVVALVTGLMSFVAVPTSNAASQASISGSCVARAGAGGTIAFAWNGDYATGAASTSEFSVVSYKEIARTAVAGASSGAATLQTAVITSGLTESATTTTVLPIAKDSLTAGVATITYQIWSNRLGETVGTGPSATSVRNTFTCTVGGAPASFSLSATSASIAAGETATFTVTPLDAAGVKTLLWDEAIETGPGESFTVTALSSTATRVNIVSGVLNPAKTAASKGAGYISTLFRNAGTAGTSGFTATGAAANLTQAKADNMTDSITVEGALASTGTTNRLTVNASMADTGTSGLTQSSPTLYAGETFTATGAFTINVSATGAAGTTTFTIASGAGMSATSATFTLTTQSFAYGSAISFTNASSTCTAATAGLGIYAGTGTVECSAPAGDLTAPSNGTAISADKTYYLSTVTGKTVNLKLHSGSTAGTIPVTVAAVTGSTLAAGITAATTNYTTVARTDGTETATTVTLTATAPLPGDAYKVTFNRAANTPVTLTFIYEAPIVSSTRGSLTMAPGAGTTYKNTVSGVNTLEATVVDQFADAFSGATVRAVITGRNAQTLTYTTDALGKATVTWTDAGAVLTGSGVTGTTDGVSVTAQSASAAAATTAVAYTITYSATLTVTTLTLTNGSAAAGTAVDGNVTFTATALDASGVALSGYPVVFTGSAGTFFSSVANTTTAYTNTAGVATAVFKGKTIGAATITATSGGKSATSSYTVLAGGARTVALDATTASMAPGESKRVTATVKDSYGNVVDAQSLTVTYVGTAGRVASVNGVSAGTGTTDADGKVVIEILSEVAGTGTLTVAFTGGSSATSTNGNGTARPTRVASVTSAITISGNSAAVAASNAATAAAEAATDAAAEAIDAANAATDAANLAAEAADAATVAAEEARDAADAATAAVEELATQVATLMAALKAQITTLANTVAKIAKKVKA